MCNLGPRLPRYIRIVASIHTDMDMFVYSQPALEQGAGEPTFSGNIHLCPFNASLTIVLIREPPTAA